MEDAHGVSARFGRVVTRRRARLEQAGIASYWVVEPLEPMLIAWELHDGAYVEVARIRNEESWTATQPYEVTVRPADLVR